MAVRKIAFFVEGRTELSFVKKLVIELYQKKSIHINCLKITGKGINTTFSTIEYYKNSDDIEHYFLIYNCGGENNVKSSIIDQRQSLINSGYSLIVGVRDLYPNFEKSQLFKLEKGLYYGVPQKPINIKFIIPVMEIETWFLAEHTHFCKIDNSLTCDLISKSLGFNPSLDNMEDRESPANDLNSCYELVGKNYLKNEKIQDTIDALDFGEFYLFHVENYQSLKQLFETIEGFIENNLEEV